MKRYQSRIEGPETAPARCIRLLDEASLAPGVLLDLGCGRGPLAGPVEERRLQYVGVDLDPDALAEVAKRGFETHRLDLGAPEQELFESLREILAERTISVTLAVDLLEHLVAPDMLLRALRKLSEDASLIVSIPNITHLNVGAKLLLGHWDLTDRGLLDDTHLRFFSEDGLTRLFSATGWRQVEAADAEDPDSFDQRFPADAPLCVPEPLRANSCADFARPVSRMPAPTNSCDVSFPTAPPSRPVIDGLLTRNPPTIESSQAFSSKL